MWCWTCGAGAGLLSRLQRRGNVVPAWIVIIVHWTTVSLSTASRLCRRLCLLHCPGVVPACFRPGHHRTNVLCVALGYWVTGGNNGKLARNQRRCLDVIQPEFEFRIPNLKWSSDTRNSNRSVYNIWCGHRGIGMRSRNLYVYVFIICWYFDTDI